MENLANEFINDLALLCGEGENATWKELVLSKINNSLNKFTAEDAFGYRQLNEILLFCNKNIITKEFFLFLSEGQPTIKFGEFHTKVEKFRKLAMLQFGSFEYAYKYLREKKDIKCEFNGWLRNAGDLINEFKSRPNPMKEIDYNIEEDKLFLMGQLNKREN